MLILIILNKMNQLIRSTQQPAGIVQDTFTGEAEEGEGGKEEMTGG